MGVNAEKFFTKTDRDAINAAISEVEKKSSGEIVVMVVDSSDRYADVDSLLAIIGGALFAVIPAELFFLKSQQILTRILPDFFWSSSVPDYTRFTTGLLCFMVVTVIIYFPFRYVLSAFPLLRRFFLTDRRMEREVRDRAIRAFHQHGLHNTRDETGILFLISLHERKVYVLADKGIYSKIKQSDLDGFASAVAAGIAHGRTSESLCESIRTLGADLAKHFPAKHDDSNEISNEIITG